ncbi:MAG: fatty acyl-AMP ligase [Gemmatimonadota bacterium]
MREELAGRPANETLGQVLERAAGCGRGIRFVDRSERASFHSYEELYEGARRIAGGLHALGLRRGDRVALVLPTSPAFCESFFGAVLAGMVPVPLYPPVRLGRLAEYHADTASMLVRCGARLVVTDRRLRRLLGRTIARARPDFGCLTVEDMPRRRARPDECSAGEPAFIQFSSGTTAVPKPIRLTHRNVLTNAGAVQSAIISAYPEGPGLTHAGVGWVPLYHDMGLVGCVITAIMHPADLTLIPPEVFVSRPAIWLRTISRYRGTVSPAPNFAYALCADRIRDEELDGVDLSCWRVALNGAEPVTPSVLQRFIRRFAPFGLRASALTPVYGLAEATLAVTFGDLRAPFAWESFDRQALEAEGTARPAAGGVPLVSVGRPLPGLAIRIVDDRGEEVAAERVGRVLVRGEAVMQGYHEMPEETAAVLRAGWLDTGDLGFMHDGRLFLHGRRKDMIVVRGRKYPPQLIEQCLDPLDGVRKGCVAALGVVPENSDGEQLVVLIERARSAAPDDESLADAATRRIALHTGLVPAQVVVLEPGTLPRTSSGKIRRAEARRRHLAGTLRPPRRAGRFTLLREMAVSTLREAIARRGGV